MKILEVYPTLTHPVNAGNKQWLLSQVNILKELGHEVYIVCVDVPGLKEKYDEEGYIETKYYWGNYVFVYRPSFVYRLWSSLCIKLRKRLNGGFFKCDNLYPWGLGNYIEKLNNKIGFDVCIVNYYWLSKALKSITTPIKAINTHDIFSFRNLSTHSKIAWMCTTPNEEAKGLMRSDYIFALQDEEAIFFKHLCPSKNVLTVYCPYKTKELPVVNNHNLVMLASSNALNIKGVRWFCSNIFPYIIKDFPDVKLVLGGYICNVLSEFENYPHIELIGCVDDPSELYRLGNIAINPCDDGTGLKIKTFEALSYGRISMTHPHSTIGIYKKENSPVFYSDNAREWVEFLKMIWREDNILKEKMAQSVEYIEDMNQFIKCEYMKLG